MGTLGALLLLLTAVAVGWAIALLVGTLGVLLLLLIEIAVGWAIALLGLTCLNC